jgi:hypothetical protein
MLDSNFKLRNMKRKILSILFVGAVFASCQKDRLNPIPQTSLSDAVAFDTPDRALQQVNGIYSALKAVRFTPVATRITRISVVKNSLTSLIMVLRISLPGTLPVLQQQMKFKTSGLLHTPVSTGPMLLLPD